VDAARVAVVIAVNLRVADRRVHLNLTNLPRRSILVPVMRSRICKVILTLQILNNLRNNLANFLLRTVIIALKN
jgi:hypothetical protein